MQSVSNPSEPPWCLAESRSLQTSWLPVPKNLTSLSNSWVIPSGKRLHTYGKSPLLMGQLIVPMAVFNSYLSLLNGNQDLIKQAMHHLGSVSQDYRSQSDSMSNHNFPLFLFHAWQMNLYIQIFRCTSMILSGSFGYDTLHDLIWYHMICTLVITTNLCSRHGRHVSQQNFLNIQYINI